MNEKLKRALSISTVVHVLIFSLIILLPLLSRWLTPRKINDTISFVDLVEPSVGLPEEVKAPEPQPEPEPIKKEEIPEPPVKPVIAEAKKTPDKPKIQVSTNLVRKPKAPPQKGPKLTPAEIKKLLAAGVVQSSGGSTSSGDTSPLTIYYALVKAAMYEAWDQPDGLSGAAGLVTQVSIHIQRDGFITSRKMVRGSGNSVMDQSVMKAVQAVSKLRPLPDASESYMDISIDFELTGNTL